jgi:hypothetical protein
MTLITQAYEQLFQKESIYQTSMEYNRRLAPFNANIRLHKHHLRVNLNLEWKGIDNQIKIGLIQHLLLRLFKSKRHTQNIDLYNNFLRNIDVLTPKDNIDPHLEVTFEKLNTQFFFNQLEKPNLQWGTASFRKLGSYNFHNDTITVSTLFKDASEDVLGYLVYHEMLHKHHKFSHKNGRSSYHSTAFRQDEKQYPNQPEMENALAVIARQNRPRKSILSSIFR